MFRDWLPFSFQLGWPQVVLVAIVFSFLLVAMFIAVRAGYRLSLGLIGFKFEPISKLPIDAVALEPMPPRKRRKLLINNGGRLSANVDTHAD